MLDFFGGICYNVLVMNRLSYFSEEDINNQIKEVVENRKEMKYLRCESGFFKFAIGDNNCHITMIYNQSGFIRMFYKDAQMCGGSINPEVFGMVINKILEHNIAVEDVLHPVRGNEMACSVQKLIMDFYQSEANLEEEM